MLVVEGRIELIFRELFKQVLNTYIVAQPLEAHRCRWPAKLFLAESLQHVHLMCLFHSPHLRTVYYVCDDKAEHDKAS